MQGIDQSTILHELDHYDSEGGYRWVDLNGTKTKVYTKYFTGTTDADAQTDVAHGISDRNKILFAYAVIDNGIDVTGLDYFKASAGESFYMHFDGTSIKMKSVSAGLQSQTYNIIVDYYL